MDEALKRANARIEELRFQVSSEETPRRGDFLDNIRDAALGRHDPRGSVPRRRIQATASSRLRLTSRGQDIPSGRFPILRVWERPGFWIGRIVSRHGGIDGGGGDQRRTA
jgi:hypothetical protein